MWFGVPCAYPPRVLPPIRLNTKWYILLSLFQLYEFQRKEVPEDAAEKEEMMKKLLKFQVTFSQYKNAFEMDNITITYVFLAFYS